MQDLIVESLKTLGKGKRTENVIPTHEPLLPTSETVEPKTFKEFQRIVSAAIIPRGKKLSRTYGFYRSNNIFGQSSFADASWNFNTEIRALGIAHNIMFYGESKQEQLRKQQLFELNSYLEIKVNKASVLNLPISELVPYFYCNEAGILSVLPKSSNTLFTLPESIKVNLLTPLEHRLTKYFPYQTDAGFDDHYFTDPDDECGTTKIQWGKEENETSDLPNYFICITTEIINTYKIP